MVEIGILGPGDEEALETFLLPRIESSMFLIGNLRAAGLADNGKMYEGTYAVALEGGEIVAVVAHYWNGNLVLQAPERLEALAQAAVEASGRPVHGLIGPAVQVAVARDVLTLDWERIQLDETEFLYSLALVDMVVPEAVHSDRLRWRRIEPGDLDLLTRWRVGFAVEALGEKEEPKLWGRCRNAVQRSLDVGWTWLLEDQGTPVATSAFNAVTSEVVQIGGVWTPPELRNRGYGRSVVAASLLDVHAQGVARSILFTGVDNVPAQRAYAALGFRHIGDYRLMLLRADSHA
jgi:predicted GNAT family acetyltransferase